jgi:hypothetical protein
MDMSDNDRQVVVRNETSNVSAVILGFIAVLLIASAIWYFGIREGEGGGNGDITIPIPTVPETTTAP